MKISIKVALISVSILLLVLIVMDMGSKNTRVSETFSATNNAAYTAIRMQNNGAYEIETKEHLVAEAIQDIVANKETNSDIKVQVLGIDEEHGMIDLNIIQTIRHVNGEVTQTQDRKTVILEVVE